MSMTAEAVLALAPDEASAKAARGLLGAHPATTVRSAATTLAAWATAQGLITRHANSR